MDVHQEVTLPAQIPQAVLANRAWSLATMPSQYLPAVLDLVRRNAMRSRRH